MLNRLRTARNQSGDTIIEVMVVVAILGLAFSIAYATANASVIKTRNAQEHAEALQYLNSQVELLRIASPDTITPIASLGAFCMDTNTATPQSFPNPVCSAGTGGRYQVQINYNSASGQNIYTFQVDWAGISGLGPQRERISYKLHNQS